MKRWSAQLGVFVQWGGMKSFDHRTEQQHSDAVWRGLVIGLVVTGAAAAIALVALKLMGMATSNLGI